MRRTYLDTSALRHLLVPHPRHTRTVTSRYRDATTTVATSDVAVTELHRFAQRVPELAIADVDAVLDNTDLVALTQQQLRSAGLLPDLPSGGQLRALDAIHVQAALDFAATEFLTSDQRQALAAKAAGLKVSLLS